MLWRCLSEKANIMCVLTKKEKERAFKSGVLKNLFKLKNKYSHYFFLLINTHIKIIAINYQKNHSNK